MKRLLILLLGFLVGCAEEANLYDDEDGKEIVADICPIVLTVPTVNIMVTSLDPLPANLVVAVGGDAYDLDECTEDQSAPFGIMKLNSYRTAGNLYVPFWPNSEDHKNFFPDFGEPVVNEARVRIYSRPTCNDEPVLRYEFAQVPIVWEQIFAPASGECSGGGYLGSTHIEIE